MMQWDHRHAAYGEAGQPFGVPLRADPPLVGTGVLRRGRKDLAPVTYIVRTVLRGNPATSEPQACYGGRIDLILGAQGESDWETSDDLVLYLLDHGTRLGVRLRGQGSSYTLSGRDSLAVVKGASPP